MKKLLLRWVVLTLAVVISAMVCSAFGLNFKADWSSIPAVVELFIGAAILALLNATLGKILKFVTIPLNCMTLGLFSLIINALILFLSGKAGYGFQVGDFFAAFIGSIIISIANSILGGILIKDDKDDED